MSNGKPNATTRIVRLSVRLMNALAARGARFPARLLSLACKRLTGVEVLPGATIGDGLVVMHGEGTIIGPDVVIGVDCTIYHQVSIGYRHGRCPVIGDRVTICPGAKLFGALTIGDDAVIGANAVVLHDVGPGENALAPAAVNSPRRS